MADDTTITEGMRSSAPELEAVIREHLYLLDPEHPEAIMPTFERLMQIHAVLIARLIGFPLCAFESFDGLVLQHAKSVEDHEQMLRTVREVQR